MRNHTFTRRLAALTVLFILLLSGTASNAQKQQLRLKKVSYWGNNNNQSTVPEHAIRSSDKGIVFTGWSDNTGGGGFPGCSPIAKHAVIGKIDSNDKLVWFRMNCSNDDYYGTPVETPDGGFAVNGFYYGPPIDTTGMTMIRYDKDGKYLWQAKHGSQANGTIQIANTNDHGFMLLGGTMGRDTDVPFCYVWPPVSFQPQDWVLMKLDSLGKRQWTKTFGTSGDDNDAAMFVTDGLNYYVVGVTESKDHECADVINHPGVAVYLMRFNQSGQFLSSKGNAGVGGIRSVMFDDRDKTIVIWGWTTGNTPDVGGNHGLEDMFVMKLDTLGNLLWAHQYGGARDERATGLSKGPGNTYLLTGNVSPVVATDSTPIWLVWLDNKGVVLDQRVYGGNQGETVAAVFYDSTTNLIRLLGASYSRKFLQDKVADTNLLGYNLFLARIGFETVGVEDTRKQPPYSLLPNPAHAEVLIRWLSTHAVGILTCTNASGQQLYRQGVSPALMQHAINTEQWPRGVYTLCWQAEGAAPYCQQLTIQ